MRKFITFCLAWALAWGLPTHASTAVLSGLELSEHDSVLVMDDNGQPLFSWQIDKPLIPASLTKLATAHLAIEKWGVESRFHTDFLIDGTTLWVKGYGDPYLISEEIDRMVTALKARLLAANIVKFTGIYIDNSYFDIKSAPGRSKAVDPYNAPVSAVAANFNTAKLSKNNGRIESAEAQTPLTQTARRLAYTLKKNVERINLVNAKNAQSNFAELLLAKLNWRNVTVAVDRTLNPNARLIYRHVNTHTLADVLRGTLEFSNNFIANQVFLKLSEGEGERSESVSFLSSQDYSNDVLATRFGWKNHYLDEGSGLSRSNRLSARQIDDLLADLTPHKNLFKKVKIKSKSAVAYAKTGTLDGVRSYAGYITIAAQNDLDVAQHFRFVFNFNRAVPYRYRNQILDRLISDLENR